MDEQREQYSALLDIYGALLSDRQRDCLDLYYNDDLSLAEIAENLGITRQGVRDAVKRGANELVAYEERLRLSERFGAIRREAEKILSLTADGEIAECASRIIRTEDR